MLKRYPLILTCFAVVVFSAISAHATLTYWVDTANQQITFNGSAAGVPADNGSLLSWDIVNLNPSDGGSPAQFISGSVTDSIRGEADLLSFYAEPGVNLIFTVVFDSVDPSSGMLTIDNLVFSYANLNEPARSYISSLVTAQTPMELFYGSDYGNITYGAPIPEVSHFALLLACGTVGLLVRRRIKGKKTTLEVV